MKTLLVISNYVIGIPIEMKYECSFETDVSGITIKENKIEYEIVYNKSADWIRLLINNRETGEWKDLPFHNGTYEILPNGVSVSEDKYGE